MFDLHTWITFLAAAVLIVIVPGPSVTVIIANSLRAGSGSGLLNVAGNQVGLLMMVLVLAAGLKTIVMSAGEIFDVLRILGAAYLIWLGLKMWRSDGRLADPATGPARSSAHYFWQGFLVVWSNPKALLFYGAFIPQFIDPTQGNTTLQVVVLGGAFMVVAAPLDSAYALAAGKTGALLSRHNVRWLERLSGSCLIGGGVWLALSRRAA